MKASNFQLKKRFLYLCVSLILTLAFSAPSPATVGLGDASYFAAMGFKGVEVGKDVIVSSAQIHGHLGVGAAAETDLLKSDLWGDLYLHSTATKTIHPDFIIHGTTYDGTHDSLLDQAVSDAINTSGYYASIDGLDLGDVTGNLSLAGSGGLNVYDIGSIIIKERTWTLTGGPDDIFVFNVTGNFEWESSVTVLAGISAAQVLFNVPTANGVAIFKEETDFKGTVLAPLRIVDFQKGTMHGAIISDSVKIHSEANLTHVAFVPEPATIMLLGLGALALLRKRS